MLAPLFSVISVAALLQAQGGSATLVMLGPFILIFAIMYFLLIMPQKRRQKQWQAMLNDLKTGDKVVTSGGLAGTIVALRDQFVHLRVPPNNTTLEVARTESRRRSQKRSPRARTLLPFGFT